MARRQRILVTGANGFVGSQLCAWLAHSEYEVWAAVRRRRADVKIQAERVFEVGDLSDATEWKSALAEVDAIAHLAARAHHVDESATQAHALYQTVNVDATRRLARCAADAGVARFVFLSTVKVHGESSRAQPFTENDPPAPVGVYAGSKWQAEQALAEITAASAMELVVLRPPLVYGPGVRANFRALLAAVSQEKILPLGSIDNRRSLIYVGNLASAIEAALIHPQAAGKTFLVSDGAPLSTAELARRLAAELGVRSRLWPCPGLLLRMGLGLLGRRAMADRLLSSLAVDSRKIRETLKWKPPFTQEEGLAATCAAYQDRVMPGAATGVRETVARAGQ